MLINTYAMPCSTAMVTGHGIQAQIYQSMLEAHLKKHPGVFKQCYASAAWLFVGYFSQRDMPAFEANLRFLQDVFTKRLDSGLHSYSLTLYYQVG